MVPESTNQRKTLNALEIIVATLGFILVAVIAFLIMFFLNKKPVDEPVEVEPVEEIVEEPVEEVPALPDFIDFQDVVDGWASGVSGNKSVWIFDLDRDEPAGAYNPDESYNTASLYKLFVVYAGYQKVQSGEWVGTDMVGATGHTVLECLDLAIRESNSECAESLWSMIGRENLTGIIINEYGISNSNINNLISNPQDITMMMQIFYQHQDITDENLIGQIKDSFLNQPVTEYNWRQGLPSGFSRANVYNKVGWDFNPSGNYWNIYHDAAIVEFPNENRHFIVVVMTNRVPFQKIVELGSAIEKRFYGE